MSWFSRNELSEKASALEQENDSLRADLESAQTEAAKVPELSQEVAGLKEDNESLEKELQAAKSDLVSANEQLEAAKAPDAVMKAIESAVEDEENEDCPIKEAVNKLVTNRIVASGHPPLDIQKAEQEESKATTISRSSFNNLSYPKRNAFIREGGKITE
jgi:outer membrane murein-binding lipoprotein Lpp